MIEANTNLSSILMEDCWKVVQFYATGCVMCRLNKQILENNEERLGVKVVLVNGTSCPEVAKEWGVTKAPTVFVVDASGNSFRLADGLQGKQLLDAIKEIMDNA